MVLFLKNEGFISFFWIKMAIIPFLPIALDSPSGKKKN